MGCIPAVGKRSLGYGRYAIPIRWDYVGFTVFRWNFYVLLHYHLLINQHRSDKF